MLVKVHHDIIRNGSVELPPDAPFRIRGRVALNWYVAELDSVLLHDERSTAGAIEAILKRQGTYVVAAEPMLLIKTTDFPNDPLFVGDGTASNPEQWGLKNTGSAPINGVIGADSKTWQAWDVTRGDSSVVVAVFDTGISLDLNTGGLNHPDLDDNTKIILGRRYLWDGSLNQWDADSLNVRDGNSDNFHGTRMSGIIGAESNNETGIAGVASNAQLLIMKICYDEYDGCSVAGLAKAMDFVVNHSANNPGKKYIASMSFGGWIF